MKIYDCLGRVPNLNMIMRTAIITAPAVKPPIIKGTNDKRRASSLSCAVVTAPISDEVKVVTI